jgi:hypothetical protein
LASLGVSLEGRGSIQGDSVDCEPRHCASKDTLSELDFAHVCKCVLGWQQGPCSLDKGKEEDRSWRSVGSQVWGPTIGRREQQKWAEERHEHNEMLCLWKDGSLCRTMSQEEEEARCVSSDIRGDRVQ